MILFTKIRSLFDPKMYQGWGYTRRYFEGWYFKVVNADETKAFAFIPRISMNAAGEKQAFIQVLDGRKKPQSSFLLSHQPSCHPGRTSGSMWATTFFPPAG